MSLKRSLLSFKDKIRFIVAKTLYDYTPSENFEEHNIEHMRHVVILKTDGKLGDTEVMTHFYTALRKHVNKKTGEPLLLSVICSKNLEPIYRDILKFDQVLTCSRKPKEDEIKELSAKIKAFSKEALLKSGNKAYCDTPANESVNASEKANESAYSTKESTSNKAETTSACLSRAQDGVLDAPGYRSHEVCPDLVVTTETRFRKRDFLFNKYLNPRFVAGCDNRVSSISYLLYDDSSEDPIYKSFMDFMSALRLHFDKPCYTKFYTKDEVTKVKSSLETALSKACGSTTDLAHINLIGVNPFASTKARSMSVDFTSELINFCIKDNEKAERKNFILLLSPPGSDDFNRMVIDKCSNSSYVLFLEQGSTISEYAASFELLNVLITVDTAAVHLACASRCKIFAIYNGLNLATDCRWQPLLDDATVINLKNKPIISLSFDSIESKVHEFLDSNLNQ